MAGKPKRKLSKSAQRAIRRESIGWCVTGSSYEKVRKNLAHDSLRDLKTRIKRGEKPVFLELGCDWHPQTLKMISDNFREEIADKRLEVHATHMTAEKDWGQFLDGHEHLPVKFHNASIPEMAAKGIEADIIWDHFGPTFHSDHLIQDVGRVKNKLLRKGGIYAFHIAKGAATPEMVAKLEKLGAKRRREFEQDVGKYRTPKNKYVTFHLKK